MAMPRFYFFDSGTVPFGIVGESWKAAFTLATHDGFELDIVLFPYAMSPKASEMLKA